MLPLNGCFPSSDETYDGGHISSTNISALIKQFIILEVSDCERHTQVRHEASLSLLSCDPTREASAAFGRGASGRGSASCWSKVTHRSSVGQQLSVLLNHHHRVGGGFEALSPRPFYITGRLSGRAFLKYTLEITL